jgi:hypothetical protein
MEDFDYEPTTKVYRSSGAMAAPDNCLFSQWEPSLYDQSPQNLSLKLRGNVFEQSFNQGNDYNMEYSN